MAGFDEGIAAFLQGFASMFAPAAAQSTALQRQAQEAEKERKARAAERDADRTERRAEFGLIREDRLAEREEGRKRYDADRAAARDELFIREGFAQNRATQQDKSQAAYLKTQFGYQKDLAGLASRETTLRQQIADSHALALRSQDVTDKERFRVQALKDQKELMHMGFEREDLNRLQTRYDKLLDNLGALDVAAADNVAAVAKAGLDMAFDNAKYKMQFLQQGTSSKELEEFADKFVGYIKAKANPRSSGRIMEMEADALGKVIALSKSPNASFDEKEAAMKAVRGLPGAAKMMRDADEAERLAASSRPSVGTDSKPISATRRLIESGVSEEAAKREAARQGERAYRIGNEPADVRPNYDLPKETQDIGFYFDDWASKHQSELDEIHAAFVNAHGQRSHDDFKEWVLAGVRQYAKPGRAGPEFQLGRGMNAMLQWARRGKELPTGETKRFDPALLISQPTPPG